MSLKIYVCFIYIHKINAIFTIHSCWKWWIGSWKWTWYWLLSFMGRSKYNILYPFSKIHVIQYLTCMCITLTSNYLLNYILKYFYLLVVIFFMYNYVCVCSNANPLYYYVLRVPRKLDRWRSVWSIFESHTAWADHITCGMSICIVYWRRLRLGWL